MNDSLTPKQRLPIEEVLPQILTCLAAGQNVMLQAPTGAGKTTRLPPALLDAGLGQGKIYLLQPRRVAARAAAARMASERGQRLGAEVGFHVRFEAAFGSQTRILTMTEGIFLRRLQEDPFLEDVDILLFDEFHERNLNADLGLALARSLQRELRPDLRLVVMSATLQPERLLPFLEPATLVASQGRSFPVQVEYHGPFSKDTRQLPDRIAAAVTDLCQRTDGHVLVFLPGVGEIRQVARRLEHLPAVAAGTLLELYGDLPPERQDAVLKPSKRRKIILSTNIAETSLTIDGCTGVVDTGLARHLELDPTLGLDRLVLGRISQNSATQRTGRAGRTAPGLCIRLWSESDHRHFPPLDVPELLRTDLARALLELFAWGEADARGFAWFEAPSEAALVQAERLLFLLEAIQPQTGLLAHAAMPDLTTANATPPNARPRWQVTALGRQMAQLPVHPRLARLLLAAADKQILSDACLAAALLSERDPWQRQTQLPAAVDEESTCHLFDQIVALQQFQRHGYTDFPIGSLLPVAAHNVWRAAAQLATLVTEISHLAEPTAASRPASHSRGTAPQSSHTLAVVGEEDRRETALRFCLLVAFPDRLVRRRPQDPQRGVLVGGRGVRLAAHTPLAPGPYFLALQVDAGKAEAQVRLASLVDPDWLTGPRRHQQECCRFDEGSGRVLAVRQTLWQDLVLEEVPISHADETEVAHTLAAAALNHWDQALPWQEPEVQQFLARAHCFHEWLPELDFPVFDRATLQALLPEWCRGRRSLAELQQLPLHQLLEDSLRYEQRQWLEHHLPTRLTVPSGSKLKLTYEVGRPPVLAVRIQEVFGWQATPTIARGRVRILLHLLAPNYRPQQVTDDLASFWKNTYPVVRKELRARYPKHAWPEDPTTATPQKRPNPHSS